MGENLNASAMNLALFAWGWVKDSVYNAAVQIQVGTGNDGPPTHVMQFNLQFQPGPTSIADQPAQQQVQQAIAGPSQRRSSQYVCGFCREGFPCYNHDPQRPVDGFITLANTLCPQLQLNRDALDISRSPCGNRPPGPLNLRFTPAVRGIHREHMEYQFMNEMDTDRAGFMIRFSMSERHTYDYGLVRAILDQANMGYSDFVENRSIALGRFYVERRSDVLERRMPQLEDLALATAAHPLQSGAYLAALVPGTPNVFNPAGSRTLPIEMYIGNQEFIATMKGYEDDAQLLALEIRNKMYPGYRQRNLPGMVIFGGQVYAHQRLDLEMLSFIHEEIQGNQNITTPINIPCIRDPFIRDPPVLQDVDVAEALLYNLIGGPRAAQDIHPDNPARVFNDVNQLMDFLNHHFNPQVQDLIQNKLLLLLLFDYSVLELSRDYFARKISVRLGWSVLARGAGLPPATPEGLNVRPLMAGNDTTEYEWEMLLQTVMRYTGTQDFSTFLIEDMEPFFAFAVKHLVERGIITCQMVIMPEMPLELGRLIKGEHDIPDMNGNPTSIFFDNILRRLFEITRNAWGRALLNEQGRKGERWFQWQINLPFQQLVLTAPFTRKLERIKTEKGKTRMLVFLAHSETQYIVSVRYIEPAGIANFPLNTRTMYINFENLENTLHALRHHFPTAHFFFIIIPCSIEATHIQIMAAHRFNCTQLNVVSPLLVETWGELYRPEEPERYINYIMMLCTYSLYDPVGALCVFLNKEYRGRTAFDLHIFHVTQNLIGREKIRQGLCGLANIMLSYRRMSVSKFFRHPWDIEKLPVMIGRRLEYFVGMRLIAHRLSLDANWQQQIPDVVSFLRWLQFTQVEIETWSMFIERGEHLPRDILDDAYINETYKPIVRQTLADPHRSLEQMLEFLQATPSNQWPQRLTQWERETGMLDRLRRVDPRNTNHSTFQHVCIYPGSIFDLTNPFSVKFFLGHVATHITGIMFFYGDPHYADLLGIPRGAIQPNEYDLVTIKEMHTGLNMYISASFIERFIRHARMMPVKFLYSKTRNTFFFYRPDLAEDLKFAGIFMPPNSEFPRENDAFHLRQNFRRFESLEIAVQPALLNRMRGVEDDVVAAFRHFVDFVDLPTVVNAVRSREPPDLYNYLNLNPPSCQFHVIGLNAAINMEVGHLHDTQPNMTYNSDRYAEQPNFSLQRTSKEKLEEKKQRQRAWSQYREPQAGPSRGHQAYQGRRY